MSIPVTGPRDPDLVKAAVPIPYLTSRRWRPIIGFGTPLTAVMLAGCVPPSAPRPSPLAPERLTVAESLAGPSAPWPKDDWWRDYRDPQLDGLEAEALAGSPTLRQADARVRQAAATAREEEANALPQVGANASAKGIRITRNQGYPDLIKQYLPRDIHSQGALNLDLSWQLDLFGRNRAAIAAARSDAEAARLDAADARLFLSTSVAAEYAELNRLFRLRAVAVDALRVRRDTLGLIGRRLDQGLATKPELDQEASFVPLAEGDLLAIDRGISAARHRLAALVGAGPDRGLAIAPPTASGAEALALPANLPLELVGRRPDLAAARIRIEAADRRVAAARRDFYPNLNLVALAGVQSFGITDLFTRDALAGSAGPTISLPIFQGGRLRANLRGADAGYDDAVATYDALLLGAVRDVADAVADKRSLALQIDAAARARASAEQAYQGMRRRYQGGLASHLEALTAENSFISAQRAAADLQAQSLLLDIALIRALGGGFVAPDARLHGDLSHG